MPIKKKKKKKIKDELCYLETGLPQPHQSMKDQAGARGRKTKVKQILVVDFYQWSLEKEPYSNRDEVTG